MCERRENNNTWLVLLSHEPLMKKEEEEEEEGRAQTEGSAGRLFLKNSNVVGENERGGSLKTNWRAFFRSRKASKTKQVDVGTGELGRGEF